MLRRAVIRLLMAVLIVGAVGLSAQASDPDHADAAMEPSGAISTSGLSANGLNEERILGVMPNYATVNNPTHLTPPLTAKQKWNLALQESIDPFNLANAVLATGFSQMGDQTPKYGEGAAAFGKRYGAALADFATQNVFSAGVLACLLHQDPRYFRLGPEHNVLHRIGYSASRLVVARQDSGASAFNASGIFGMMLGIVASNAYYPSASVSGEVMLGRVETSLTGGLIGNLTSEFWPDCQLWMHHHRPFNRF